MGFYVKLAGMVGLFCWGWAVSDALNRAAVDGARLYWEPLAVLEVPADYDPDEPPALAAAD